MAKQENVVSIDNTGQRGWGGMHCETGVSVVPMAYM